MPSPPKPWEKANNNQNNNCAIPSNPISDNTHFKTVNLGTQPSSNIDYKQRSTYHTNSSNLPNNLPNQIQGAMNGYGMGGYGATGYPNYGGGYGSYGSGYVGQTGYGSSYGGGYNSYGGYNRMPYNRGIGMQGYNRYGMQPNLDQNGMPTNLAELQYSSQNTFQLLERVVQTFSSFSQLIEASYFATHSSFMSLLGVAEQVSSLRNTLGHLLGFYALARGIRNFIYKLLGKKLISSLDEFNYSEFEGFNQRSKFAFKPIIIFLACVFGIPYLLHKLMKKASQNIPQNQPIHQSIMQMQPGPINTQGYPMNPTMQGQNMSTTTSLQDVEFAQARYEYKAATQAELSFNKGELIAVLSRDTTQDNLIESKWWHGRLRNGATGVFPANYVEILNKKSDLSQVSKIG